MEYLKEKGESYDIVVLLQPTSPLRDAQDIDNALGEMIERKAGGVISVINVGVKPFKSYYLNESGFLKGVHNDKTPNMRRQDLPDAYLANGAIYAVCAEKFLKTNSLITESTIPYIMNFEKSIDIDTKKDIQLLKKRLNENT